MFNGNLEALGGVLAMGNNVVNPYEIMATLSSPIASTSQQINVLLQQIQSSPTPNQADILQLQMYVEQFNNYILLASSLTKAQEDNQKQVINNISS